MVTSTGGKQLKFLYVDGQKAVIILELPAKKFRLFSNLSTFTIYVPPNDISQHVKKMDMFLIVFFCVLILNIEDVCKEMEKSESDFQYIVKILDEKKLTEDQYHKLLLKIYFKMSKTIAVCDQCYTLAINYETDCEAYKHYRETLCAKCVKFCGYCERYYSESAQYKHDECYDYNSE